MFNKFGEIVKEVGLKKFPKAVIEYFIANFDKRIIVKKFEEHIKKKNGELFDGGAEKIKVGKVKILDKEYAISLIVKDWRDRLNRKDNNEFLEKIQWNLKFYQDNFSDFTNDERIIKLNDKDIWTVIQPWIDTADGFYNLFQDIVGNKNKINNLIKENNKFKIEFQKFSEKIIENYDKYGVIPDFFGKYPNFIFDGDKIKIIDLHIIFYNPENVGGDDLVSQEIKKNGVSWEKLIQGEEYILNLLNFLREKN